MTTRILLSLKLLSRIPDILLTSEMVKGLYLIADKTLLEPIQGRSKRMGHASLRDTHSGGFNKRRSEAGETGKTKHDYIYRKHIYYPLQP